MCFLGFYTMLDASIYATLWFPKGHVSDRFLWSFVVDPFEAQLLIFEMKENNRIMTDQPHGTPNENLKSHRQDMPEHSCIKLEFNIQIHNTHAATWISNWAAVLKELFCVTGEDNKSMRFSNTICTKIICNLNLLLLRKIHRCWVR